MTDRASSSEIGYAKPPAATRFKKWQSGNPRGRPKGRRRDVPYDHVLGQMVVVRENGRERRVTAAEAFLLHLTKRGMEGDSASARASLAAIEEARARREVSELPNFTIVWRSVSPGSVGLAVEALGLVHKAHKNSDKSLYRLKTWIVEMALARLGEKHLTEGQQRVVVEATRTPHKVEWPDWWKVRPSDSG